MLDQERGGNGGGGGKDCDEMARLGDGKASHAWGQHRRTGLLDLMHC